MERNDVPLKKKQVVDARARNISHNFRCTECGSQSIEDSQADIAILLRKLIRDEIQSGKSDKEIYKKLEDDFGETVFYAPKFDMQTAALRRPRENQKRSSIDNCQHVAVPLDLR
ncbi:hypothetical protein LWI29_033177 [Acer saccharum]|uniref:Cytochrome c-type biogenesis protein n=1 Tax=Acer saccharum TaxID=4024 RepID=A0AA39S0K3_ACESA|nr:hypothetical protein LWI29_033177 [Acer saccharum]